MTINNIRQKIITSLHLLFWFTSIYFWNTILNPGIESVSVFQGVEVEWDLLLFLNFIFLLYISLPFVWLARKLRLWIKIGTSVVFLIPLCYVAFELAQPDQNNEEVTAVLNYFLKNFTYVLAFHLTIASAVYINLKKLIPGFLNRSRFALYIGSVIGVIILSSVLNFCIYDYGVDKLFPSLYFISYFKIWELMLIITAYLLFTSGVFLADQYAHILIEKRDAARNELSALKAQINPHFLFNNLNTVYSMASQKDERTSDVILKLSDFLRYVLYDTSSERIPLKKEVDMIKTYVALQKERVDQKITTIELETSGDFSRAEIAPLLLLPLAENCFKHGVGKEKGTIKIIIKIEGEAFLFRSQNRIALREKSTSEKVGGIGIKNVEKRLNLLYPNRHSIDYQQVEGVFVLEMKIDPLI